MILKWDGCNVAVCYHLCLNCEKKFNSFSRNKDKNWLDILINTILFKCLPIWLICSQHSVNSIALCREGGWHCDCKWKIGCIQRKFAFWIRRVNRGNLVNVPSLEETVVEDASLHPDFVSKDVEHQQTLCISFEKYFSCGELQTYDNWIRDPFMQNLEDVDDEKQLRNPNRVFY